MEPAQHVGAAGDPWIRQVPRVPGNKRHELCGARVADSRRARRGASAGGQPVSRQLPATAVGRGRALPGVVLGGRVEAWHQRGRDGAVLVEPATPDAARGDQQLCAPAPRRTGRRLLRGRARAGRPLAELHARGAAAARRGRRRLSRRRVLPVCGRAREPVRRHRRVPLVLWQRDAIQQRRREHAALPVDRLKREQGPCRDAAPAAGELRARCRVRASVYPCIYAADSPPTTGRQREGRARGPRGKGARRALRGANRAVLPERRRHERAGAGRCVQPGAGRAAPVRGLHNDGAVRRRRPACALRDGDQRGLRRATVPSRRAGLAGLRRGYPDGRLAAATLGVGGGADEGLGVRPEGRTDHGARDDAGRAQHLPRHGKHAVCAVLVCVRCAFSRAQES